MPDSFQEYKLVGDIPDSISIKKKEKKGKKKNMEPNGGEINAQWATT